MFPDQSWSPTTVMAFCFLQQGKNIGTKEGRMKARIMGGKRNVWTPPTSVVRQDYKFSTICSTHHKYLQDLESCKDPWTSTEDNRFSNSFVSTKVITDWMNERRKWKEGSKERWEERRGQDRTGEAYKGKKQQKQKWEKSKRERAKSFCKARWQHQQRLHVSSAVFELSNCRFGHTLPCRVPSRWGRRAMPGSLPLPPVPCSPGQ